MAMRFKIILAFLILFVALCGCSEQDKDNLSISKETQVSGEITVDTVWTLDKSPYIVVDNVVVESEVTLTIEPRVEIRFERDKGLTVKGILNADGSAGFNPSDESELIKFTSNQSMPDMNDWQGIKFDNTNDDKSRVSYSKIQYAKIGIDSYSSLPKISDNFVEFNEIGIRVKDLLSEVSYNVIRSNINGMFIAHQTPDINRNTISYNETGIVVISRGKVEYNNFKDNTGYSIVISREYTTYATNNWWNTIKIEEIEKQIYHKEDRTDLGRIFYMPYSTSPISDAYPRFKEN